jgi:hypothetical protein
VHYVEYRTLTRVPGACANRAFDGRELGRNENVGNRGSKLIIGGQSVGGVALRIHIDE